MSQGKKQRLRQRKHDRYMMNRPLLTLAIEALEIDATRFQYKINHTASGDTDSLSHVSAWNFASEGILDVWLDPSDQKTYVVNGHNRLLLARRLNVARLPCKYLFSNTWQHARRDGAIANISQGCGTTLDAARFFRDGKLSRKAIKRYGISLSSNLVKHGLAIAGLCDRLFDLTLSGRLIESHGAILGSSELSEDEQISIYRAITAREDAGKIVSDDLLREIVSASKYAAREQITELTLFGSECFESVLIFETAEVQAFVRSYLSRSRRALVSATRSQDTLEAAGNVIAVESSIAKSDDLATLLETFDREKSVAGEVATAIAIAAKQVKNGVSIATASQPVIDMLQG